MAVNVTATRTSSLFTDQDGDGVFDPGDIILTRIRITNSGGDPATGVSVTDSLNGVTLVPGSVQVTPIAFDDLMPSITGNTPITFTSAQLLGNDIDPDGAEINITISGVSNASNGTIVNNGDGTFTFTPTTGFVGTASFQYTITDEQGLSSVTTGIVSFTVTDPVWYVNNATGSDVTGDGSYAKPFATLAPLSTGGSADSLDNADDTIFVYNAGTYSSGIVLENGQKLFGDGHAFSVNGLSIGANGSNTTIGFTGVGVTLASNNTIMGVTLNGSGAAAVAIQDNGDVGTLVIDETSITGQGKAVAIDSGGTLNVDLDQLSSASSGSEGVHLQGVTGTFTAATGHIQTSTGTAVLIGAAGGGTPSSGGDVNFTYGGDITSPGGSLVEIQDRTGGTVTFSGSLTEGAIGNGQTGILIDGSAGTINFNGQTFISAGAGTTGNGVTLTNNSGTINFAPTGTGLDITTTAGSGLVFTGGGTLNITGAANSVVTGTGQILNLQNGTMGTSGIAFQTLTSGTVAAGNAININNLDAAGAGTFSGGAVTIGGTGGAGTDGINITSSNATFGFASATIDNTQGDGIEINGQTQTQGAVTFTTVNIDGVGGVGVNIVGATNAVNINGGTIGATNDPAGDGVNINGGTGAVTVAASVTKTTLGNEVVDISNHSGGAISFTGAIASNSGGGGIRIVNNSGGTIGFTGDVSLSTGTLAGLTFTNTGGTGATVTFSGGTTDITTTSGTGINATNSTIGAGSLTISGASNTVAASTGRAINVDGVTLNATLLSVNVSGGGTTTGVFLKNTGGGGQFVVTGTGSTAGSGGTIANIGGVDALIGGAAVQGTAIYMENVSNVSLSNMIFGATGGTMNNLGIRGDNVNNFTLRDSEFRGTFGTTPSVDEGAIRFGTQGGNTGLTGTALFEGNNIQGGVKDNVAIFLYGSNSLNLTFKDSASDQAVFGHNGASGGDSLLVESGGTSNLTMLVDGVHFDGARSDIIQTVAADSTVQNITVQNSTFFSTHATNQGNGISIGGGGNASNYNVTYLIQNNQVKGTEASAINTFFAGYTGTIRGVILNNTLGTNNGVYNSGANDQGSNSGSIIFAGHEKFVGAGAGSMNYALRIEGNHISDGNQQPSVFLRSGSQGGGTSLLEVTFKNNVIDEADNVGPAQLEGLYLQVGGTGSGDNSKLGIDMIGNTINMTGGQGVPAIAFDQGTTASQFFLPGYGGPFTGAGVQAGIEAFLNGKGNATTSGGGVAADITPSFSSAVGGQAFSQPVPSMAANPNAGLGWEDLVSPEKPVGDPQVDTSDETGGTPPAETGGTPPADGGTPPADGGTPADSGTPPPTVVNDGVLTLAELGFLVEAAIQRWIDAGATAAQVEAMRAVEFGIVDMAGIYVGTSSTGVINIDSDGAGYGWFVDATPDEDSEYDGSGTRLTADVGGPAAGKLDLLTVLMHELGHQIGLGDEYVTVEADDIMFGYMNVGERRLPEDGQAAGATPGSVGATAFALTPVSIGTLPSNKTVDIFFKSTINTQSDGFIVNLNNDSTISGSNFSNVVANEQNTLDSLTLGNVVFIDANKDGDFDAGEGLAGVSVSLYADTNNSGGWDSGDALLSTQSTLAGGLYSFTGLAPGDYIVVVNATNFNSGQVLEGRVSITGGTDPDDNIDNDDNGLSGVAGLGNGIASQTITLDYNTEPDGTPDVDGDADADTNLTLDFGFITPNAAPTSTNLDGDIASYIEGASPVKLDVGGNATLSDPTSADFAGGTLTVAIGTGADTGEDVLSIGTTATVTLDAGNTVKVGGTTIGTYAGGTNGDPLVITLNSSANAGNVDDLLQALQYNNTNLVDPSTDSRAVSITLVDGDGTDGGLGTDTLVINTIVNVTGVNDPPSGAATGSDSTDDATTIIFDETDFNGSFSDPDGDDFAGIVISTLPATGKLQFNGSDITAGDLPVTITLANLQGGDLTFVPDSGSGGTSVDFDFAVYDDGGTQNGGVDTDPTPGTFTITIAASDIAPAVDLDADNSTSSGTGFASAYTEGGAAAAISDTDVDITDADSGDDIVKATITITNPETGDKLNVGTLPAAVTVDTVNSTDTTVILVAAAGTSAADFEAAIEAVTFSSTSDDPTDKGTNTSRTITVTVNDGDLDSVAATATVAVTDVNDAPTGTSSTITAIEDSFRVLDSTDLGFNDVDGTLASVTISAVTGGKIYFDSDGAGGADPVEATLPQTYTAQQLADGKVSFKADQDVNGSAKGTITFTVTDDDGADAASSNVLTVDVTATNDQPSIPNSPTVNATEQVAIKVNASITVSDVDLDARNGGAGDYSGAAFAINRAVSNPDDLFSFDTSGALFTVNGSNLESGGNVIATLSQSGGILNINFVNNGTVPTTALVNDVLQHLQYTNSSDAPPASVTLLYVIDDGAPGGGQGAVTASNNIDGGQVTINIAAVNDAPVNSLGGTIGTGEDAVDAWLSGMSISDPDANPATDDIRVTFHVDHGKLEILTNVVGGITAGDIVGGANDSDTITVQATLNEINATLAANNGLTYSPDAHYNGSDTLTVTTNDRGFTGTDPLLTGDGASEETVSTRTITISAQPDAPVAQPDAVSTPENVIGTGSLFADNGSGPDVDADGDTITVSAVSGGTVGVPFALASGAILTVNSDGTYSYNPNGKFTKLTDNTSGAVNTSTVGDTFQYTVTGGNTVTVTVTVNGVAGPGDWLMGDGTGNTITGTPQADTFVVSQGGDDNVSGLAGKDIFYFGGALTPADIVNGGADLDTIVLQGDYSGGLTLDGDVTGIEGISFLAGTNTAFGDPGTNLYDYVIITANANFAAGLQVRINGSALLAGEDLTFDGSAEADASFVVYGGKGTDTLTGGLGNDIFFFAGDGRFAHGDVVNGGAGYDGMFLRGNYTIDFTDLGYAGAIQNIENLTFSSASDERYARGGGTEFDYDITWANALLGAGQTITINGALLQANETLVFDGSNESDGKFRIFGGAAADQLTGGAGADLIFGGFGADTLYGGAGNDQFRYDKTGESTSAVRDRIEDFASGDVVDLSKIDANTLLAGNQAFNFIGAAAFGNNAGELRFENVSGTEWLVQGDINGDGVSDFEVVLVINDLHPITSADFIL
ncbi:MAG TPA: Ig-like domain-containing protein [Allosphingosinicella sp.]